MISKFFIRLPSVSARRTRACVTHTFYSGPYICEKCSRISYTTKLLSLPWLLLSNVMLLLWFVTREYKMWLFFFKYDNRSNVFSFRSASARNHTKQQSVYIYILLSINNKQSQPEEKDAEDGREKNKKKQNDFLGIQIMNMSRIVQKWNLLGEMKNICFHIILLHAKCSHILWSLASMSLCAELSHNVKISKLKRERVGARTLTAYICI